jgi:hypothetical protein
VADDLHHSGAGESSLGSVARPHASLESVATRTDPGSSTAAEFAAPLSDPVAHPAAAHADPPTSGHDPPAAAGDLPAGPLVLESVQATEILPSGSSTATDPVVRPMPGRLTTRLSQGVTRPKLRTDGTVRWCM